MNVAVRYNAQRRLHVLLADDDADSVRILAALLLHEGHTVSAVYSGSQVLEGVKRYQPDVCILDIEMPGQSGYAAAREVVERLSDGERPVLVGISGIWTGPADRLIARHVGFSKFFLKGDDPQALLAYLEEIATSGARPGRAA
jgi:CheY-like chemotaxis protein